MKRYALCLIVLLLAGCSSEPTSDDFREFAESEISWLEEPETLDDGYTVTWDVELDRYDLRKTDSLTSPIQGTVTFVGKSTHVSPEGKTKTMPVERTYTYGWMDGEWEMME